MGRTPGSKNLPKNKPAGAATAPTATIKTGCPGHTPKQLLQLIQDALRSRTITLHQFHAELMDFAAFEKNRLSQTLGNVEQLRIDISDSERIADALMVAAPAPKATPDKTMTAGSQ